MSTGSAQRALISAATASMAPERRRMPAALRLAFLKCPYSMTKSPPSVSAEAGAAAIARATAAVSAQSAAVRRAGIGGRIDSLWGLLESDVRP